MVGSKRPIIPHLPYHMKPSVAVTKGHQLRDVRSRRVENDYHGLCLKSHHMIRPRSPRLDARSLCVCQKWNGSASEPITRLALNALSPCFGTSMPRPQQLPTQISTVLHHTDQHNDWKLGFSSLTRLGLIPSCTYRTIVGRMALAGGFLR